MKTKLLAFLMGWASFAVMAQPSGSLDLSFHPTIGIPSQQVNKWVNCTQQADGKMIFLGYLTTYNNDTVNHIVRTDKNGNIDTTFNTGSGFNGLTGNAIYQKDNKIIILGGYTTYNGQPANRIVRLNPNGEIDSVFQSGSGFNNDTYNCYIQPDDKLIVTGDFTSYNGYNANRIIRLHPNGSVDSTFGNSTGLNGLAWFIDAQPNEKLIVGGYFNHTAANYNARRIVRFNIDGSIDSTFNTGTGFNNMISRGTKVYSDGKILAVGQFTNYNGITCGRIIRLNPDGDIDTTFNPGTGANGTIYAAEHQNDGKIILAGEFTTYNGVAAKGIARINANGAIDSTFATGSGFSGSPQYLIIQEDGKIVLTGPFTGYNGITRNYIARIGDTTTLALQTETSEISPLPLIYPNPANEFVNIKYNATAAIVITNMQGQTLISINPQDLTEGIEIPTWNLPKGLYIVRIKTDDSPDSISKLIIQ